MRRANAQVWGCDCHCCVQTVASRRPSRRMLESLSGIVIVNVDVRLVLKLSSVYLDFSRKDVLEYDFA
jgi:hypothetical protein